MIEDTEFKFSYQVTCDIALPEEVDSSGVTGEIILEEAKKLKDEWSEGSVCTGIFDGSTPTLDQVTLGRYDTSELPIQDIMDECEDWCGMYSDQGECCFYWANDYNSSTSLTGGLGQYGCGVSMATTMNFIEDFVNDAVTEFSPYISQVGSI